MICPYCKTENRDERPRCYHCDGDLVPLRSVILKSRHHFNTALEHTERGRNDEAIAELKTALELDSSFVNAWVVLGTILARQRRFREAEAIWKRALALDSRFEKCHAYLLQVERIPASLPLVRKLRAMIAALAVATTILAITVIIGILPEDIFGAPSAADSAGRGSGTLLALLFLLVPILAGLAFRLYAKLPAIIRFLSSIAREDEIEARPPELPADGGKGPHA